MIKQLGRGVAAAMAMFLLTAASEAPAQTVQAQSVQARAVQAQAVPALNAGRVDATAKPLGTVGQSIAKVASAVAAPVSSAITTVVNAVSPVPAAQTVKLAPDVAREAAWLSKNGWPLYALVDRYAAGAPLSEEANCVAIAVYHEARGENLEGQMAVARVIMNRAASGKYPASWCGTVKQPWQFSFVNPKTGHIPYVDQASASWRKAVAITRLAVSNAVPTLSTDVLWYHADYVAPSWGRRLTQVSKIGTHIFYRA